VPFSAITRTAFRSSGHFKILIILALLFCSACGGGKSTGFGTGTTLTVRKKALISNVKIFGKKSCVVGIDFHADLGLGSASCFKLDNLHKYRYWCNTHSSCCWPDVQTGGKPNEIVWIITSYG